MQARVSQKMEMVMGAIRDAHPLGVRTPELIDLIYGARADGCPVTADEQVGKLIKRMREYGYPIQNGGRVRGYRMGESAQLPDGRVEWKSLDKAARIDAIRSVYRPGATTRDMAKALGVSKSVVCGFYFRYKEALADCPLVKEPDGRPKRPKRKISEPRVVWTAERRAEIAALLKEGKSAQQIGDRLGVARNAIIGLVHRNKELKAIGFSGTSGRRRGSMSEEERRERQREASRRYKEKQRTLANPNAPVRKPFKPVIVSNNVDLMVQDFIAKNGVRKFEAGGSTDYYAVARYLEERGYRLTTKQGAHYCLAGPGGRPRRVLWRDALAVADRFRVAEGLEPILAA